MLLSSFPGFSGETEDGILEWVFAAPNLSLQGELRFSGVPLPKIQMPASEFS